MTLMRVLFLFICLCACNLIICGAVATSTTQTVYFGTQSSAIYIANFTVHTQARTEYADVDTETRSYTLSTPVPMTVGLVPSWLELNKHRQTGTQSDKQSEPAPTILYTVNENIGKLQAFSLEASTHMVNEQTTLINTVSNYGDATCHIQLDKSGKFLGAVNYGSGSFYLHAVNGDTDGSIVEEPVFSYTGGVHPHQFLFTEDNRYVFVPDLGADRILQYVFDASNKGPMTPNPHAPFLSVNANSGPRHLAFNPVYKSVVYGSNELDSTLNVYSYDDRTGTLTLQQTLSTLPSDHVSDVPNYPSEVMVSPDGRHVYIANRGNDTIAKFAVIPDGDKAGSVSGLTTLTPVGGNYPRFIGYDLTHSYVFACNQNSNNVAIFEVVRAGKGEKGDGDLRLVGSVDMPTPQHAYFVHF
jgi:6-phosphogluconolactonase